VVLLVRLYDQGRAVLMQKFDVVIALEGVREAKWAWAKAVTKFNADIEYIMARLLHEAARNYMSPEEVAHASGFTTKRIRILMRAAGLDPKKGKTLLSKLAAETLAENAALMGIAPHEMDLMSPLAYLPMGDKMRRELAEQAVSRVTELPEDDAVSGNIDLGERPGDCQCCTVVDTVALRQLQAKAGEA
jgi:hypothetical protein